MDDDLVGALSFIKSSAHRQKILESLSSTIKTPSEIAKETDMRLNHTSMYLGELKKKRLIICLNEGSRKGRLYQITGLGKRVLEILNRE